MGSKTKAIGGASIENNVLYASKGRLELLSLGVGDGQLQELAASGVYLSHIDLRSPIDGLVLSRTVSPLQKIDRGTECFRIADLGKVWIEADVYDLEARYIQPGMEAKISLPKENKQFTARVSDTPPRFDAGTRTLKVRLEMDNPENVFRPDMFVNVDFLIPLPESLSVPSDAVIDSGKRKTVYVVIAEGVFEPRAVVTGWWSSDRVEIAEGLKPGEKIVVSGNFLIDSESRMKLAAARLMEDGAIAETPPNDQMPLATKAPEPPTVFSAIIKKVTGSTDKDQICGMTVDREQAKKADLIVEARGKTYYFCSEACKVKFEQGLQRYLAEKANNQARPDAPGHGEHRHD
jgi:Cu(I)/Ag(I) efflux system membrane fusion protein